MSSTIGNSIKVTLFGESHGEAVGVVIDSLPAGEPIDLGELEAFLARRAPGGRYASQRKEMCIRDRIWNRVRRPCQPTVRGKW